MFNSVVQAVFSHAETKKDKICLADEKGSVTYSEYKELILNIAAELQSLGVKEDDKVVIEASQTIDFLATALAVQLIGGVFVPVERNCAWDKTLRIAETAEAVLVVSLKEQESGDIKHLSMASLAENAKEKAQTVSYEFSDRDTVCELLFSTGTTGKEKGIVITNGNNIALAENVMFGVEMEEDNVEMIPSPLNHSHGLRRYYANMVKGATVVLATGVMNVIGFFGLMDKYGVNSMDLVPTALTVLLKLSKGKFADYKDVMRYIQFGSAPLSDGDKETIRTLLPDTHLYNFYGSTESGCICIYDFNDGKDKPKCIGKPTHNAKIVIVDEERKEIGAIENNTGLLASFGGMNMKGYWKDDEETARVMFEGGIYSNDESYFDEDGDIILLGRKGDVINVAGNKVSPDEIEDVVKKMHGVEDCGCIGISDPLKGNTPKLFVQMKKGCAFDSTAIRAFIAGELEPYKVPSVIEEIELIPRSFNGKLLRRALRNI